ncbi:MAG: Fe-S cluster assembly protein SufD [Hahellaceae bacterium]|nr:Fe-S cluster assembly protein SufD [Hahellaceae bacterium]MCP5168691.1 Fe-S cluster assembly protein SufD [Hahellaceae bacterium]
MNAVKKFPEALLCTAPQNSRLCEALQKLQQNARAQLDTLALPTRKNEDWRYSAAALSHLDTLSNNSTGQGAAEAASDGVSGYRLVLRNGLWQKDAGELPENHLVEVISFEQLNESDAALVSQSTLYQRSDLPFAQLNTAHFSEGLFIRIKKNQRLDQPLVIQYDSEDQGASYPKLFVLAESGAQATLIEEFTGASGETPACTVLTNSVTELRLQPQSQLTLIRLDLAGESVAHTGLTLAQLQRDSRLETHCAGFGGKLRRHDLKVALAEPGAECKLNGVCVTLGQQHYDNHTEIEHIASHCNSEENYRCIAADSSRIVFNGRIHIHRDAQKSNGAMNNRNLLLSNDAEIDTKPELEIYADDVKCAHGTTIGQLNEEELFYLLTRGIPKDQAATMLTLGFVVELVYQIPDENVRTLVEQKLEAFIHAAHV